MTLVPNPSLDFERKKTVTSYDVFPVRCHPSGTARRSEPCGRRRGCPLRWPVALRGSRREAPGGRHIELPKSGLKRSFVQWFLELFLEIKSSMSRNSKNPHSSLDQVLGKYLDMWKQWRIQQGASATSLVPQNPYVLGALCSLGYISRSGRTRAGSLSGAGFWMVLFAPKSRCVAPETRLLNSEKTQTLFCELCDWIGMMPPPFLASVDQGL